MSDYVAIPNVTEGVNIATVPSVTKAGDATDRLIEVVSPISRKKVVSRLLDAPYREITPVVAERSLITDLLSSDAKLIDCSGYSELCVRGFTWEVPDVSPGFDLMVVGYLLQNESTGNWSPVAVIEKSTTGMSHNGNSSSDQAVPVTLEGITVYADTAMWTARIAHFDRVAIYVKKLSASNISKLAVCYTMA